MTVPSPKKIAEGAAVDTLYVVALMVARGTGNVEGLESSGPFPANACREMANFTQLIAADETPGYDLRVSCAARNDLEGVIARNNCRIVDSDDIKGLAVYTYTCEANWLTRLLNWSKSLLN